MKEKLWTGPYVLILTAGTFTSLSFYMIMPMITKYAVGIGATLTLAGTIAGLFSITALIVRPVSGLVADRSNRKALLLISTGCIMLCALMYSISTSIPMLIFTRIVHGAAFAFSGTVTVAIVAATVPRSRLGEGIGYQGMGHILATALGPNLGIIISDNFGYRPVFLACAALIAVAMLIMAFLPNQTAETLRNTTSSKFSLGNLISLKILPLAIIGGFFSLLNGAVSSFLVLLGDERGIANIGIYFTVNAACLLIIRPVAGRVTDKKGLGFVLIPCLIFAAAAAALIGSAASLAVILAASVLKAVGQGSGQPAIQASCIKMLPHSMSGLAASTFYIGADIGQGLGPVIGGAISGRWGYDAMFYFCAGLMLCGVVIYVVYSKRNEE